MPIEMPRGLPFSVDTWTPSSQSKRHHFLTHAHRDHSVGISAASYPIHSTRTTKSLVLKHFPQLDSSCFVDIEVGQSLVIDDPDGSFTVTAFDANHCPGAVMFLFEGEFGTVLHTGDCRLTPECLQNLPEKYIARKGQEPSCRLDYVFLDCTFGKYSQRMPSKYSAIRQVINCIWKHPEALVVYLTCDLLGQEEILVEVSRTFGSKIYVDKSANPVFYQALTLTYPDIISEDSSSRFHLFDGFPRLYERAKAKLEEAQANSQPEPLIIRPSTQWYACEEVYSQADIKLRQRFHEAVKDQFGVWHVCYSIHSSKEELEWALQLLMPKWVVSTTPNCWAMELDYVKKNCLASKIPPSDPLWKLLDISLENSSDIDTAGSPEDVDLTPVVATQTHTYVTGELQQQKLSVSWKEFLSFSPPRKRPALTLFGRSRMANLEDLKFSQEASNICLNEETPQTIPSISQNEDLGQEIAAEGKCNRKSSQEARTACLNEKTSQTAPTISPSEGGWCDARALEVKCRMPEEKRKGDNIEVSAEILDKNNEPENCRRNSYAPVGMSNSFNEKLRKLYRSMNVPVPRPLPSLVELNSSRRTSTKRSILR